MGRPAGQRNRDFEARRDELAGALARAMIQIGPGASLRELTETSGASLGNVKHYFGDRDGVYAAAVAHLGDRGRPFMDAASRPIPGPVEGALRAHLDGLVVGWRDFGVGRTLSVALAEGLSGGEKGPAYVNHMLEPTLQTTEALLGALVADGRLPALDTRVAALALVGPVILALLHQGELGGAGCRPMDLGAFLTAHLAGWLRGWAAR